MSDDPLELASAYLDGETTADERAQVEETPAIEAEVDRLRAVRAMVADVPEPRVNIREQHLAAAFEAWDRLPGERDATPRSTRRDRARRSPTTVNRWMLGAAAALVVVLAGGLTLRSLTDRDDADDTTAEVADQPSEEVESTVEADGAAEVAEAEDSAADTGGAEDESMALSEAVEIAEEEATDAADPDPGTADLDTDPSTDDAASAPPADDDLAVLTTAEDLASFAADALEADGELAEANEDAIAGDESELPGDARTIPPVDEESLGVAELPECPQADLNIGPARYDEVEVVVAVDAARRWVFAFAIDDCEVVARVRLDSAAD